LHALTLLVGKINGTLEQHIAAVDRDRAEADDDRIENHAYRKEVRTVLASLTQATAEIPPLAKQIDAIDNDENPKSIASRLGKIEPVVDDPQSCGCFGDHRRRVRADYAQHVRRRHQGAGVAPSQIFMRPASTGVHPPACRAYLSLIRDYYGSMAARHLD
jgi:hypothetical protein